MNHVSPVLLYYKHVAVEREFAEQAGVILANRPAYRDRRHTHH